MAIADPKNYQAPKAAVLEREDEMAGEDLAAQVAALQQTVQALLASKGSPDDDRLEKILLRVAQMSADAQERAANPSNKTHPGISVFSRPKGDREDPRADLKCPMFWVGYPVDKDTTTDEEINLFNLAEPGIYSFLRTDGRSRETLTIEGSRDAGGQLTRLLFTFQAKENSESLPGIVSMLRQAFGVKSWEELELERLRAELAQLRDAQKAS